MLPYEVSFGDLFLPRMLVSFLVALAVTQVSAKLMNKYRISRYFSYAPLVYVCMLVIYTVWIDTLFEIL